MDFELDYNSPDDFSEDGCFLGNGKLGIVNGGKNDGIAAQRVVMSRNICFRNGQYMPNVIDMFNPFTVEFISLDDMLDNPAILTKQSLNMNTGIATNEYAVGRNGAQPDIGLPRTFVFDQSVGTFDITNELSLEISYPSLVLNATSSIYCVRHMPYTTVHTIECKNICKRDIRMLHQVHTLDNIIDVSYENTYFVGSSFPLYVFTGHGRTVDGVNVAFASCYVFENTDNLQIRPMGAGITLQTQKRNLKFNCFDIMNIFDSEFKLHIVTTFASSHDFDDPKSEVVRICTNICAPNPVAATPQAIMSVIRGKHVDAWGKLWATKLKIGTKNDATLEQLEEVRKLNTCMYSALYYIYSSVRENFRTDVNPNAIPIIDLDGSIMYEMDLWLLPLLLLLKPELAKTMIEYRFMALQQAKQLASSYGYEGAKIPYIDDIMGYKNNLYYNTNSFVYLFNTCMVSINTWNYYRISKDKGWLRDKGYNILKEIADYLSGVVEIDDETGEVRLLNTNGLTQKVSAEGNTFTINLVKLALKYAIEASYELKYEVIDRWSEASNGLTMEVFDGTRVFKFDKASSVDDFISIIEPLFACTPGLWENMNRNNYLLFIDILKQNYNFYDDTRVLASDKFRPMNIALRGITSGVIMTTDGEYLATFMSHIRDFLRENVTGAWKCMTYDPRILNKRSTGIPTNNGNSLSTNAMFLMLFIQGIAQMRIIGGISGTRFYYEDLKISYMPSATMPHYWSFLTITNFGIGNNKGTIDIRQNVYDMLFRPPNVGGAYIVDGDFDKYTP